MQDQHRLTLGIAEGGDVNAQFRHHLAGVEFEVVQGEVGIDRGVGGEGRGGDTGEQRCQRPAQTGDRTLHVFLPQSLLVGTNTWPCMIGRAVRRMPARITFNVAPSPVVSMRTSTMPDGCSIQMVRGLPSGRTARS